MGPVHMACSIKHYFSKFLAMLTLTLAMLPLHAELVPAGYKISDMPTQWGIIIQPDILPMEGPNFPTFLQDVQSTFDEAIAAISCRDCSCAGNWMVETTVWGDAMEGASGVFNLYHRDSHYYCRVTIQGERRDFTRS